jgi:hypothetical protein
VSIIFAQFKQSCNALKNFSKLPKHQNHIPTPLPFKCLVRDEDPKVKGQEYDNVLPSWRADEYGAMVA